MKKIYIYTILFLIIIKGVNAQGNGNIDNLRTIIPPSPNASSISKFGEWPVSLYTGIPDISVPIYNIKAKGINLPISLSYHAAGIRVGEVASLVGLGWALNAGGVITRSVKGLPDDYDYFSIANTYYNDPNNFSSGPISSSALIGTQKHVVDAANSNEDSQMDDYRLNILGKSYSLMLAADGTVYTRPFSNVKISTTFFNGANTWNVVLEDGTKILFGGNDSCTETNLNSNFGAVAGNISYTSAWYVRRITTVNGEVISFKYNTDFIDQDTRIFQSDFIQYQLTDSVYMYGAQYDGSVGRVGNSTAIHTKADRPSVTQINLSSIESDNTRVDFIANSTSRLDLQGAHALSEIKIYSKLTNAYIDDFTFNYAYSTCTTGNEYTTNLIGNSVDYLHYRLKLMSLNHNGNPSNYVQPEIWSFEYNPLSLPSRMSYAQDHWGFYNGALSNSSLLPRLYFSLPFPAPGGLYDSSYASAFGFFPINNNSTSHTLGAIRYPNEDAMQAEILTKVKYPTGGYSQFQYEANSNYINKEILRDTTINLSMYNYYGQTNYVDSVSYSFSITRPQYVQVNQNGLISAPILADNTRAKFFYRIINLSTGKIISSGAGNVVRWINLLAAGNYKIVLTSNLNQVNDFSYSGDYINVNTSFQFSPSYGIQTVKAMYGGLRIKSIVNYDGITNITSSKNYLYDSIFVINPIDSLQDYLTTQSIAAAGNSFSMQAATYTTLIYDAISLTSTVEVIPGTIFNSSSIYGFSKVIRNSMSKYSLGSIQGGTVGYGLVTVINNSQTENGKTVSHFSNVADNNSIEAKLFPYPPTDSREWRRGLLLDQSIYNSNGTILSSSSNTYSFINNYSVSNFVSGYSKIVDPQLCPPISNLITDVTCGIFRRDYLISTEKVFHNAKTEIIYSQNGQTPLTTVTNYYYDNPNNSIPIRTEMLDSKGNLVRNISRTALEKNDINTVTPLSTSFSTAIDSMIARNIVGEVLQQEQNLNSNLLKRQTQQKKLWPNNLVQDDKIFVQIGNNTNEARVQFNQYDTFGNLNEQQKPGGAKEVYLWGYNNQYPVAKISGTDYSSTIGVISQNQIDAAIATDLANNTNGSNLRSLLNNLRSNPNTSGGLVTTFTYLPLIGVNSQTDPSGHTNYFEYDGLGRLSLLRDQDQNILKKYEYQYQASSTAITPPIIYSNQLQSGTYTKSCGTGYTGSSVVYTVPAGTYTSVISQADADSKAQADITANGQNYANTYGTCTATSTPCSITMNTGFSSPSKNIVNDGTTVSGYIVFYPTSSSMTVSNTYQIATIGDGCLPSGTRSFTTSAGGKMWNVNVYANGKIYVQLAYGSTPLSVYSSVSLNISYSL